MGHISSGLDIGQHCYRKQVWHRLEARTWGVKKCVCERDRQTERDREREGERERERQRERDSDRQRVRERDRQ